MIDDQQQPDCSPHQPVSNEVGDRSHESAPQERARALEYLVDQDLAGIDEALRQIALGAQRLLDHTTSPDGEMESGTAILCKGMAEGLQVSAGDFSGEERACLLLGYLYGTLVSPNQVDHQRLVDTLLQRRERHSTGGKNSARFTPQKRAELQYEWECWRNQGAPGKKKAFDRRMASLFHISEKKAEQERLKLQKSLNTTV